MEQGVAVDEACGLIPATPLGWVWHRFRFAVPCVYVHGWIGLKSEGHTCHVETGKRACVIMHVLPMACTVASRPGLSFRSRRTMAGWICGWCFLFVEDTNGPPTRVPLVATVALERLHFSPLSFL